MHSHLRRLAQLEKSTQTQDAAPIIIKWQSLNDASSPTIEVAPGGEYIDYRIGLISEDSENARQN